MSSFSSFCPAIALLSSQSFSTKPSSGDEKKQILGAMAKGEVREAPCLSFLRCPHCAWGLNLLNSPTSQSQQVVGSLHSAQPHWGTVFSRACSLPCAPKPAFCKRSVSAHYLLSVCLDYWMDCLCVAGLVLKSHLHEQYAGSSDIPKRDCWVFPILENHLAFLYYIVIVFPLLLFCTVPDL